MICSFGQFTLGSAPCNDMWYTISVNIRMFVFALKKSSHNGVRLRVSLLTWKAEFVSVLEEWKFVFSYLYVPSRTSFANTKSSTVTLPPSILLHS